MTTIVQQVASFTLTADGNAHRAPGGQAIFPHTLINTGNGTDAFPLTLANLVGDDFDLTGLAIYVDANGDGIPGQLHARRDRPVPWRPVRRIASWSCQRARHAGRRRDRAGAHHRR